MNTIFEDIIGRVVTEAELNKSRDVLTLRFTDGTKKVFGVEGDCCSYSWIEHLENYATLPAKLVDVVEEGGAATEEEYADHECLQVYVTRFRTERGDIVLEYRNSSNGYYGGYLVAGSCE